MSRTYWGTALGGTAPEASIASGSSWVAASSVTMSPELIVSTGRLVALKLPMFTVRGLGISVCSAADAPLNERASARVVARQVERTIVFHAARASESMGPLPSPRVPLGSPGMTPLVITIGDPPLHQGARGFAVAGGDGVGGVIGERLDGQRRIEAAHRGIGG